MKNCEKNPIKNNGETPRTTKKNTVFRASTASPYFHREQWSATASLWAEWDQPELSTWPLKHNWKYPWVEKKNVYFFNQLNKHLEKELVSLHAFNQKNKDNLYSHIYFSVSYAQLSLLFSQQNNMKLHRLNENR